MIKAVFAALLALVSFGFVEAQSPAQHPVMGWNSWNHFGGKVTDADVRSAADQLVSTGMRDAGYVYVNLDDTWQGKRDASGIIHPNERFPDMKALADYVHSKGLKFGIYSSPGAKTCGGYEGSLGHETQDAQTYAKWGVDFLKYDLCSYQDDMAKIREMHPDDADAEFKAMIEAYRKMGDALKATGRPIVYSLCQYGLAEPWKFGPQVNGQMWRTTDDISDNYYRMMLIAYANVPIASFSGPGHWNDPDMLEIGNGGMKFSEYRTHMTLWVMMSAPLLAGNDLSRMSEADRSLLMNREAIAIDQDALGKSAERVWQRGDISLWKKPLADGSTAVALVSTDASPRDVVLDLSDAGLSSGAIAHDVWSGKDLARWPVRHAMRMEPHSAQLWVLRK
jgi:alpha-galactosidase